MRIRRPTRENAIVARATDIGEEVARARRIAARGGRIVAWAAPALLAVVLVVLMYRPTMSSLRHTLPWNLGDPALNTWILAWEWHALFQEPTRFFDGNIFHPYGEAIKYSEMILPAVPLFGLLSLIWSSPVVAHNVVLLCLAAFCVVTSYLLARRLTGPLSAGVAAVSFSFSGFVFMHQSHLQLLTLGFIPLGFLALFRALDSRRPRDGVWLGICSAMLITASFYYGAIWSVILVAIVLTDLVRRRRPDQRWRRTMGVAAGTIAVLVGPIAYMYSAFQNKVPFTREVGGLGLNPSDLLTPAPGTLVYGRLAEWSRATQPTEIVEHGFFLGFVIMILALVGIVTYVGSWGSRHRDKDAEGIRYEMGLLGIAGAVSIVLGIGPEVRGSTMPFRVLAGYVPGFDAIRAASRLAVPALLAAAVFAAWGLQRLIAKRNLEQRVVVVALVASVVLLEMWVEPLRVDVMAPEQVRSVLAASSPGAVIELPMRQISDAEFVFAEGPRLLASIGDWRPRFNGFSGGFPPGYLEDMAIMRSFPEPAALERMAELDIRYVALHGSEQMSDRTFSFEVIDGILDNLPPTSSVMRVGDAWLVDLSPDP